MGFQPSTVSVSLVQLAPPVLVTSVSNLQILAESLLYNHNAKVAMDDHKPNTNALHIVCRSYGYNP